MQPYFFPYIGYFQLIHAVDQFIIYDNIQYTKKGWINRNRFLQNGTDVTFSIPLKNDSDFLDIKDREISTEFKRDRLLNQIREAYRRAPYFVQTFSLVEQIVQYEESNLFRFIYNSLVRTCKYLKIETRVVVSSNVPIDHSLKSQDKVLALCESVGATTYMNAIGGMELYSRETFRAKGIDLKFIKSKPFVYEQFGNEFIPWLSIVDVMMFNPLDAIRTCISTNYELI
ncbi:MAG: WbqC family protein [Nitrospiraceae bacterium]|nr:WbqC family protein [Nitrospiraceae bacterium]